MHFFFAVKLKIYLISYEALVGYELVQMRHSYVSFKSVVKWLQKLKKLNDNTILHHCFERKYGSALTAMYFPSGCL